VVGRRTLRVLPVLGVWAAAATALAIPARRVVDWYVMTDELLYERLAFSVTRTHSPLPILHGRHVPPANQLYPVLLGVVGGDGLVPDFLTRAHTFNAVVMTSAAVPAYLVTRMLVTPRAAAYAAALLTAVVPWLVLASFVLSEAVAYPAFVWAVYLVQRTVARPSAAHDALAVAGLVVAFLARTQFAFLVVVALVAIPIQERGVRQGIRRHPVLAAVCAVATAAALVLLAGGHNVFGAYDAATQGSLLGVHTPRAFLEHCAQLALGLGLLPAVAGAAWLGATGRRSGPALVAVLAIAALLLEVTSFDLRFGNGLPKDRYLFYAAPLLLAGFVGAVADHRPPRASLVAPLALVVAGLALAPLPVYGRLNVDMPVAVLDEYIRANGGRAMLVAAALLLVVIFLLAPLVVPRRVVAVALVAATVAALASETAYAFDRLFSANGTSGRPVTLPQGVVFDWVDRTLGPDAGVTMIPYAQLAGDYWATAGFWWDLEFWNRSVTHAAYPKNRFAEIQTTFPKLDLRFDPRTGAASASPTRYVAESDRETRFRVHGATVSLTRDVRLIDAGPHWRADWLTFGLDDDGFTRPGVTAVVRVYPLPGQSRPLERFLTIRLYGSQHRLAARIGSTSVAVGAGNQDVGASVCVPPHGYATIRIKPRGEARVYGDLNSQVGIYETRVRSVQIERISLADETSPC
jgi:hypothetical protein